MLPFRCVVMIFGGVTHPLDNIVGNPSHSVSTRKQLASDALWCCFHTELSRVKPKNFKMAIIEDCWFQAMGISTSPNLCYGYRSQVDLQSKA
ncbi:hypothetical protein Tco_0544394 [Tanacetum coccineum]